MPAEDIFLDVDLDLLFRVYLIVSTRLLQPCFPLMIFQNRKLLRRPNQVVHVRRI